jgi:hypothetical protein
MKIGAKRSRYALWEVTVYAVLTLAVGLAFILSFMDSSTQQAALSSSQILPHIFTYRELIIGGSVVAVVLFGIFLNEEG